MQNQQHQMDLDNVATGSTQTPADNPAPTPPATLTPPLKEKLSELPATKAMKTKVKNMFSKYGRLQDRLLKYKSLLVDDASEDNCHLRDDTPAVLKAAQKLYQFRLVDVQTIRKDTLQ